MEPAKPAEHTASSGVFYDGVPMLITMRLRTQEMSTHGPSNISSLLPPLSTLKYLLDGKPGMAAVIGNAPRPLNSPLGRY